MIKKLLGDFGVYGIAPFIPKVASIAVLPLITPFLTREDYGLFGIVTAYTGFFEMFFHLGLFVTLSNTFFKSRMQYKWFWRQVYGFLILWNIVFAVVLAGILYWAIPEAAAEYRTLIVVLNVVPLVFFGPTEKMAALYFQLRKEPLQIGIRSAVFGTLNILITLYTIRYLQLGYMGWFWALFVTQVLTNISWWVPLNLRERITPIFNFRWATIRQALRISLPIIPHNSSQYVLTQSDRVVMDVVGVKTEQIGEYNVAYTGSIVFSTLSLAYLRTMAPYILDLINRKQEVLLRRLIFGTQSLFLVAVLAYACIAREFFLFLFRNDQLNTAYPLSVLISTALVSTPMYMGANNRLFYYEKTRTVGFHSLIAAALNVALNFVFVPQYGIVAAALTTFVSYQYLAYSRYYSAAYRSVAQLPYYPTRWVLITVGVALLAYLICLWPLAYRYTTLVLLLLVTGSLAWYYKALLSDPKTR